MMKKSLILLFAFGIASVVNAAGRIELAWDNEEPYYCLNAGELITFNWIEDGDFAGGFAALSIDVEAGKYVDGSLKFPVPGGLLNTMAVEEVGWGFQIVGGISYLPGIPAPDDGIMMTFQFYAPDSGGSYLIDISGGYAGADASHLSTSFLVYCAPEPLSAVLLGVGGLLASRLKRQTR